MAVTCARCGTQNPDGNQFCQACGTPLAVAPPAPIEPTRPGPPASPFPPPSETVEAAPPGPPPGAPPPPPVTAPAMGYQPSASGYQSPYYAQAAVGPQPQVHRTPWFLIISAVVALVVVMAGCGTALAIVASKNNTQNNHTGIPPTQLPSPTPAGTPKPSPGPNGSPSPVTTPTPTQQPVAGATASNAGESVSVPSGWTVVSKDDQTIVLTDRNSSGSVTIASGPSRPVQSAQQNKDTLDKFFTGKYPDTANCPKSTTATGALNGASGIFWELCFTLVSGGQSIPAAAPLFAGANSDGSVYYLVMLVTRQDNMDSFISESAPILQNIQWKL